MQAFNLFFTAMLIFWTIRSWFRKFRPTRISEGMLFIYAKIVPKNWKIWLKRSSLVESDLIKARFCSWNGSTFDTLPGDTASLRNISNKTFLNTPLKSAPNSGTLTSFIAKHCDFKDLIFNNRSWISDVHVRKFSSGYDDVIIPNKFEYNPSEDPKNETLFRSSQTVFSLTFKSFSSCFNIWFSTNRISRTNLSAKFEISFDFRSWVFCRSTNIRSTSANRSSIWGLWVLRPLKKSETWAVRVLMAELNSTQLDLESSSNSEKQSTHTKLFWIKFAITAFLWGWLQQGITSTLGSKLVSNICDENIFALCVKILHSLQSRSLQILQNCKSSIMFRLSQFAQMSNSSNIRFVSSILSTRFENRKSSDIRDFWPQTTQSPVSFEETVLGLLKFKDGIGQLQICTFFLRTKSQAKTFQTMKRKIFMIPQKKRDCSPHAFKYYRSEFSKLSVNKKSEVVSLETRNQVNLLQAYFVADDKIQRQKLKESENLNICIFQKVDWISRLQKLTRKVQNLQQVICSWLFLSWTPCGVHSRLNCAMSVERTAAVSMPSISSSRTKAKKSSDHHLEKKATFQSSLYRTLPKSDFVFRPIFYTSKENHSFFSTKNMPNHTIDSWAPSSENSILIVPGKSTGKLLL